MKRTLLPMKLTLILLTLVVAACQDDGPSSAAGADASGDAGSATGHTFRAHFNYDMTTDTDEIEGALAPAIAPGDMVSVEMPASSGRLSTNARQPRPAGLETSAYLLSYRRPDGTRAVETSAFSTGRLLTVDAASADLRAVAVAPMWTGEAREQVVEVVDSQGRDSLATFTLPAPSGPSNATEIDGAAGAGHNPTLVLETRWADGRERRLVAIVRMANGESWEMRELTRDAQATPAAGVQHYRTYLNLSAAHPQVYVVALDE